MHEGYIINQDSTEVWSHYDLHKNFSEHVTSKLLKRYSIFVYFSHTSVQFASLYLFAVMALEYH